MDGGNSGRFYLFANHLGSVVAVTDSSGQLQGDLILYEPFGDYRSTPPDETNPDITDRGFTNQKHNNDLKLIYYGARYYMPGIGRFLSPDTIVPDPTYPQSLNRYSYVVNSPVKYSDPSGHCPQPSGEWADANIICVAGFIPTKTSTAWDIGPIERFFVGDDRDFSSNSDELASRFWVWINSDTGEIVQRFIHPTQRASAANSEPIGEPFPPRNNPAEGYIKGWFQGSNNLEAKVNDDGSITFDYSVVCSDPACNIFLAPNGSMTFSPNDLGSYDVSGIVNSFPNLEAYHWQNGELQGDHLFQIQNFSPQEIASGNANMITSLKMSLPTDLSEFYSP